MKQKFSGWAVLLCISGSVVTGVLQLRFFFRVSESSMDCVFQSLFKSQCCLEVAFLALVSATCVYDYVPLLNAEALHDLCAFSIVSFVCLRLSLAYSTAIAAIFRFMYLFFPLTVHSLSKTILLAAMYISWIFFTCMQWICIYSEVYDIPFFYMCVNCTGIHFQYPEFTASVTPDIALFTTLVYIAIMVGQRKMSVRGACRRPIVARHNAILRICFIQYIIILLSALPGIIGHVMLSLGLPYSHFSIINSIPIAIAIAASMLSPLLFTKMFQ